MAIVFLGHCLLGAYGLNGDVVCLTPVQHLRSVVDCPHADCRFPFDGLVVHVEVYDAAIEIYDHFMGEPSPRVLIMEEDCAARKDLRWGNVGCKLRVRTLIRENGDGSAVGRYLMADKRSGTESGRKSGIFEIKPERPALFNENFIDVTVRDCAHSDFEKTQPSTIRLQRAFGRIGCTNGGSNRLLTGLGGFPREVSGSTIQVERVKKSEKAGGANDDLGPIQLDGTFGRLGHAPLLAQVGFLVTLSFIAFQLVPIGLGFLFPLDADRPCNGDWKRRRLIGLGLTLLGLCILGFVFALILGA